MTSSGASVSFSYSSGGFSFGAPLLDGEAGASGSALFSTADSASGFFAAASMVVGALDGRVFFAFGLVAAFLTPAAAAFFLIGMAV